MYGGGIKERVIYTSLERWEWAMEGEKRGGDECRIYPTDTHCLSPEGGRGKACSLASSEQVVADGSGGTWGAGLITHLLL